MNHPLRRVTMVNTSDRGGGAELIALSMLDGFNAAGTQTTLAVGAKHGDDPRVIPFNRSPHLDYDPYTKMHARAVLEPSEQSAAVSAGRTSTIRTAVTSWSSPRTAPDLVLCHNLHGGFFDLRVLPWLSHQVPVVLMLHDSWLFSGHCAWGGGCPRWETGCGSCPTLRSPPAIERDATRGNWLRKRDILAASRLFVAAPSQWALERANRSILAGGMVEARVIPHGVDSRSSGQAIAQRAGARSGCRKTQSSSCSWPTKAGIRLTRISSC